MVEHSGGFLLESEECVESDEDLSDQGWPRQDLRIGEKFRRCLDFYVQVAQKLREARE